MAKSIDELTRGREEKIQALRDAHRQHTEESKRIGRMLSNHRKTLSVTPDLRSALTSDKRLHDDRAGKYATSLLLDYGVGTSHDE